MIPLGNAPYFPEDALSPEESCYRTLHDDQPIMCVG